MERQVHCETFILSSDALPSVEELYRTTDPEQRAQVYADAGLLAMAGNVGPERRAAAAAQKYRELPAEDYQLYDDFLTQVIELKDCSIPVPEDALSVLVGASKSQLFDKLRILAHPEGSEYLLLGKIRVGTAVRYFKIAHWGYTLTLVEQLRKRDRLYRIMGRKLHSMRTVWSKLRSRRSSSGDYPSPVYFGAVTLLAAAPCWLALLPISWWLFAPVLVCMMVLCGYYVASRSSYDSAQRWTVGWLITANIVAAGVVGIIFVTHWANADRTEDVLVCGVHESEGFDDAWMIETSAGTRKLESGFYNGTFYPTGSENAARSLVGKWVKITQHGHLEPGPYVTQAVTLRPGSCGR